MTQKRGVGRPTRKHAAVIGEAVLDAARDAFCRSGSAEVSMAAIAQQLGASKVTIYSRFGNKEGLLLAVVDREIAQLRAMMGEGVQGVGSSLAALEAVASLMFDYVVKPDTLLFRSFLQAEAATKPLLKQRWSEWIVIVLDALAGLIRDAQGAGEVSLRSDPFAAAELLLDLVDGMALRLASGLIKLDEFDRTTFFQTRWRGFLTIIQDEGVPASWDRGAE